MLVLFETPAGYAIFKVLDENKLQKVEKIWHEFGDVNKAQKSLQLVAFKQFKTVNDAVTAAVAANETKIGKTLKKMLKDQAEEAESLAVGDAKLGSIIKEKFGIQCVNNAATTELMRAIRTNLDTLLAEHLAEINSMRLGLSHSLGRFKVKFNPEKIDTMIIQAVSLLDDLDKELNNYAMRCREWYGWHFPELSKLITDHSQYARTVKTMGMKNNAGDAKLSVILNEELAAKVVEEAETSMGTDISELDLLHITQLCDQIVELAEYRAQLFDYLKNRMHALAPNLTVLLGELVGARIVSRAGSLMGLAKMPASTVQLIGAEKALFRSLKTKKETPKYGIIYHAQLVSQAPVMAKGKMARKLAAKVALSTRIDALCEESLGNAVGIESRAYLEQVLKSEIERPPKRFSGVKKAPAASYNTKKQVNEYDSRKDFNFKKGGVKREADAEEEQPKQSKKMKVETKAEPEEVEME